jgi:TolB protein
MCVVMGVLVLPVVAPASGGSRAAARNGLIAFWSDRSGLPGVWVMRPDGSRRRLVTGNASRAKRGEFSPDGRRLAFDGQPAKGGTFDFDIQVIDVGGGGRGRLTHGPARDVEPRWSPDGRSLVFQRQLGEFGRQSIWTIHVDGRGLRRLASGYSPSWSPDGRRLVFARDGRRGDADVYVVEAGGAGLRRLTWTRHDEVPTGWSPDGRSILFTRISRARPRADVYVMRDDGTRVRRLTPGPGSEYAAAWSPDGRRILYTVVVRRAESENGDVAVMDADGSHARVVLGGRFDDNATSWQRVVGKG